VPGTTNVYYNEARGAAGNDVKVFASITISGDVDTDDLDDVADVVIIAYAIQAENIVASTFTANDAANAWEQSGFDPAYTAPAA